MEIKDIYLLQYSNVIAHKNIEHLNEKINDLKISLY